MSDKRVPATLNEPAEEAGQISPAENQALENQDAGNQAIETASNEYLGRWNRLVSTTNWEKGRIVAEWREALIEAGAPAAAYTDEAWSRRVGSVTPQHTGRLRRVYQRFASMREAYPGLYWSHFQAALDWDDAEMWLEGAVQNRWSISQMQGERSRTLGALVEESVEATAVEVDEDAAGVPADLPPAASSASMIEATTADGQPSRRMLPRRPTKVTRSNLPILMPATSRRRCGRSRTCPPAGRSSRGLRRLQAGDHPSSGFQLAGSQSGRCSGHAWRPCGS